jgi:hypothetical protein
VENETRKSKKENIRLDGKAYKNILITMRTTIDLPDALFRAVKASAANRGLKLKDFIAEALRSTLGHSAEEAANVNSLLEQHRRRMAEHFQRMDEGRAPHDSVKNIRRDALHDRHA